MRINFNDKEKQILLNMLIEDRSFSEIKKKLKVNKNYNLKTACEYLGGKYLKAYQLHVNNFKEQKNLLPAATNNTNNDNEIVYKCFRLISEQIKELKETQNTQIENKSKDNKKDNIEVVYLELPKVLPERLTGANYTIKHTSIKVVANVWEEFQVFAKSNNEYSIIEHLSLALLEYFEKYTGR